MNKKQIKEVIDRLNQVQSRASVRLVSDYRLERELHNLKRKKCFYIEFNGGSVCNAYKYPVETTMGWVQYDRKTNHFKFHIGRGWASKVAHGSSGYINVELDRLHCISWEKKDNLAKYLLKREQRKYPDYVVVWKQEFKKFKYQLVTRFAHEEYHFPLRDNPYTEKNMKKKLREGKRLIIARIKADKTRYEMKKYLSNHANQVFVSVEDSLKSGNCKPETDSFADKIRKEFGNIGAIRADILLEIRNDSYTRRACEVACKKYLKK